ncbi:MAG: substrate-binding domain-containing protein [Pelosinus sp.]|nr:substrate-binding domain-containing protein [Pelosinus sp.]
MFTKTRLVLFIGLCLIAAAAFAGYDMSRAATDEDEVTYLIGVSQANLTEPWRVAMNEEIAMAAAKHKNIRVIFTDAAQNSQKQKKDVDELLREGIDLLIISPHDAAELTPVVAKAYKKIPVIVLDRAVEGYDYSLYIGPDNKLIGRAAGNLTVDMLGSKGGNVIEIQGLSDSPPVRDRSDGFREVVEKHANIKIAGRIVADWQRDKAEDKTLELLARNPKIDMIFAHNDPMALGAYRAVKKLGRSDIKIIGVDGLSGEDGGLKLVRDGALQGTFTCPIGGKEAMQYAVDILHQEKGIPKKIILRSTKITADNLAEYLQQKQASEEIRPEKKRIVVGFSQVGAESVWRLANSESIKNAASAAKIELRFSEGNQHQDKQIADIRTFIKDGVDVIAFSPVVEYGWDEVLGEAKAAGIPVIISDRTINIDDDRLYTTFIGADFVEEGRKAARWLVDTLPGNNPVNIIELCGTNGSAPAIGRKMGFEEILTAHANFRIMGSETANFTRTEGKKTMLEFLHEFGKDIHVVFAHNDDMALGAIEAIDEYGLRPGQDILVVSVDATKQAFSAIMSGKLNCTVECTPLLGPELMKAIKDYSIGKKLPIKIITAEGIFTKKNAAQEYQWRKY